MVIRYEGSHHTVKGLFKGIGYFIEINSSVKFYHRSYSNKRDMKIIITKINVKHGYFSKKPTGTVC